MTSVRPNPFQTPAATSARPADPARTAAQRAFFQAALGQAAPSAPAAAAAPVASPAASATRAAPSASAAPPEKVLRPGSLLDIRV